MNAVLAISPRGRIRTVAVTPPVPVKITAELADGMGLPALRRSARPTTASPCPTDVELGADGKLYVTTEGGGLGEQMPLGLGLLASTSTSGKVDEGRRRPAAPRSASRSRANGDVFVSQLFGGEISRIKHGTTKVRAYAKATAAGGGGVDAATVSTRPSTCCRPSEEARHAAGRQAGPLRRG